MKLTGEVGRLFELGAPCRVYLFGGRNNARIACGIMRGDGRTAYCSFRQLEFCTGLFASACGFALSVLVIGIPLLLYGLHLSARAFSREAMRHDAFYGNDPVVARQLKSHEILRI